MTGRHRIHCDTYCSFEICFMAGKFYCCIPHAKISENPFMPHRDLGEITFVVSEINTTSGIGLLQA